jgi:hypothetical protein
MILRNRPNATKRRIRPRGLGSGRQPDSYPELKCPETICFPAKFDFAEGLLESQSKKERAESGSYRNVLD